MSTSNARKKILWVDSLGGLIVGVLVLSLSPWLADWYRLPLGLVRLMGVANLAYGTYSFTLAIRSRRPEVLILLLVAANLTWTILCARWTIIHWHEASWLGLAQLVGEGVYVGVLAVLEFRWRQELLIA